MEEESDLLQIFPPTISPRPPILAFYLRTYPHQTPHLPMAHGRQNTEFHLQFQDEDDEFMASLRSLRAGVVNRLSSFAPPTAPPVHPSPFKPSKALPRSPLEGGGGDAERLNAENLVLAGKVARLSEDLMMSKTEVAQLRHENERTRSPRKAPLSPLKAIPFAKSSLLQPQPPSIEELSKLRAER